MSTAFGNLSYIVEFFVTYVKIVESFHRDAQVDVSIVSVVSMCSYSFFVDGVDKESSVALSSSSGLPPLLLRAFSSLASLTLFLASKTRSVLSFSASVILPQFAIRDRVPSLLTTIGPSSSNFTAVDPTAA